MFEKRLLPSPMDARSLRIFRGCLTSFSSHISGVTEEGLPYSFAKLSIIKSYIPYGRKELGVSPFCQKQIQSFENILTSCTVTKPSFMDIFLSLQPEMLTSLETTISLADMKEYFMSIVISGGGWSTKDDGEMNRKLQSFASIRQAQLDLKNPEHVSKSDIAELDSIFCDSGIASEVLLKPVPDIQMRVRLENFLETCYGLVSANHSN